MMNYVNLFWLFGHPEVYILILPAFGVYSEVISAFSSKELYGYTSLVIATVAIAVLSFTVWLHHFFTMGQSADVNAAFGIATMTIGVPTGVKIYDWIWTMFRGEVRFTPSMLLSIAFMMTFVLGGFTGIILATPPLDYMVHNTLFLVAHFHNMLIRGLLYGMIAGYMYWFPKAFGFRLNERWGRISVGCWVVGFYLAFMPLYVLGAAGMARRTQEIFDPAFRPWLLVALIGALILPPASQASSCSSTSASATATQTECPLATHGTHAAWNGRSPRLRQSGTSRPFPTSAAVMPFTGANATAAPTSPPTTTEISSCQGIRLRRDHRPRRRRLRLRADLAHLVDGRTFPGVAVVTVIARSFMRDVTRIIPAATVEAADRRWLAKAHAARPVPRELEQSELNEGLAQWMA